MTNIKEKFKEKKGIAFIITLGLLALLMITGVSFAVYMKVERESAASFAIVGSCRQLALAGVAYAIDDISSSLNKDNKNVGGLEYYWYPVLNTTWNENNDFHGWYTNKNDFNFTADAKSDYDNLVNSVYYNNAVAKRMIPIKTFDTAKKLYSTERVNTFDVFDDEEFADTANDKEGRFSGNTSYIVVNLSGLLDPNFAGGEPRGIGGTPAQFQLDSLPSIDNALTFPSQGRWYENIGQISDATGVNGDELKCLYPFSMFATTNYCSIPTNAVGVKEKIREISEVLMDSEKSNVAHPLHNQYNRADRFVATLNLLDYLDDDNKPGGGIPFIENHPTRSYLNPCVEAFPMINEVYVKTQFIGKKFENGYYRNRMDIEFDVELWYPFISPTLEEAFPEGLNLEYTLKFENLHQKEDNSDNQLDLMPEPSSGSNATVDYSTRTITETVAIKHAGTPDNSTMIVEGTTPAYFSAQKKFRASDTNATNTPAGDYDMTITVDVKIKDNEGHTYDGFEGNMMQLVAPLRLLGEADDGPQFVKQFNWQVIDPRLNYKKEWWEEMPDRDDMHDNFGEINTVATEKMEETETDEDWRMYIKGYEGNPGVLESVGELGYLFTGDYWRTIRLYDKPGVPRNKIYEYFNLEGTATNSGYANINTEYKEVLKAALKNMPLVPDGSVIINNDQLEELTAKLKELTKDGGISPTNLFSTDNQNIIFNALEVNDKKEFEKEAFYISGMPSFRADQQLFAIFAMGNYYTSKQICMAIVWRDPLPDKKGRHPSFIRELIWLNGK